MNTAYLIRTLRTTQHRIIAAKGTRSEMDAKAAEMRAAGATVEVREFKDDAQARMYIDPACTYFRAA